MKLARDYININSAKINSVTFHPGEKQFITKKEEAIVSEIASQLIQHNLYPSSSLGQEIPR